MRLIHREQDYKNIKLIKFNTVLVAVVAVSTVAVGTLGGVSLAVDRQTFTRGVSVDGIDISGLNLEQAEKAVLPAIDKKLIQIKMPVVYKNHRVQLSADDLGLSTNEGDVLLQAFAFNKSASDSIAERFGKSAQQAQGKNYAVLLAADEATLQRTLELLGKQFDTQPVDAYAVFDKFEKSFQIIPGIPGDQLNIPDIKKAIGERVAKNDFSELVIKGEAVEPKITEEDVKRNTSLIGICETETTNEPGRNVNIRLMCEALDGQVIEPGQTLSINGLVGERTGEKGFKMAPAIIDGTLADQVGGGICQVAGTLYNAALLADMKIVERVHHSWPSSYLPVGLDATLNWDDKDLKIQNTTEAPIFVSAKFSKQTVRVELYGKPQPDNITITLDNKVLEKEDPPASDVIYTNTLPPGVQQTLSSPRTGYSVDVYRVFTQNGTIIKKELISKDNYLAVKGVVLLGTAAQQK